ncbi:MAG: TetR/AcrR family transcriptional regulator [Actinobacteria bacterium]|nr:TetR/AcrR family transcriptional regulator [Actinomycetota bacterium]
MPTKDPRKQMIRSTALLIRERGVEGTSFADVIEHSGAPRGSIYHHFPEGKPELIEEATRFGSEYIARMLSKDISTREPRSVVRRFAQSWRGLLKDGGFAAGCPLVAVAVDGSHMKAAREAAGDGFERWVDLLTDSFAERGVDRRRARSVATLVISSVEGAIVLARAEQSIAPLDRVTKELDLVVESMLDQSA